MVARIFRRGASRSSARRIRETIARTTINGWRMHAVYVPPATNDGSAFAHHVVLIWTAGRHTTGSASKVGTIRQTLEIDKQLARYIRLIGA